MGIEGLSEDLFAFCVSLPAFVKRTVFYSAAVRVGLFKKQPSFAMSCKKDGCIQIKLRQ